MCYRRILSLALLAQFVAAMTFSQVAIAEGSEAIAQESLRTSGTPLPDKARRYVVNRERPTIGLALGSGGYRGAAHIGVIRALERNGIPIDYISGTSMGSLVGGLYAAGVPLSEIERMFADGSVAKAFYPYPIWMQLFTAPPKLLAIQAKRMLGAHPKPFGLYGSKQISRLIDRHLPPNRRRIETFKIAFAAVTTATHKGASLPIEQGDLGDAIRASSAVPIYFSPMKVGNDLRIDGGIRADLPTYQARRGNADIVIAVNVNENLQAIDAKELTTFNGYLNRVAGMALAEIDEHQVELADLQIRPTIEGTKVQSLDPKVTQAAIEAGEKAATAALPEIRKLLSSKLAQRARSSSKM